MFTSGNPFSISKEEATAYLPEFPISSEIYFLKGEPIHVFIHNNTPLCFVHYMLYRGNQLVVGGRPPGNPYIFTRTALANDRYYLKLHGFGGPCDVMGTISKDPILWEEPVFQNNFLF